MQTRRLKIWRDVKTYRGRTLLVAASIMIGVLGVVALVSGADVLIRQLENDINPDEMPMTYVRVNADRVEPAPLNSGDHATLLNTFAEQPGVTYVEGTVGAPIFWRTSAEDTFTESVLSAGNNAPSERELNPMRLIQGQWPLLGNSELVIERRLAERYELSVGDTIEVRILSAINPDESETIPTEQWAITGIVFNPYVGNGDQLFFGHYAAAEYIGDANGYSTILLRYDDFATAQDNRFALRDIVEPTAYEYRGSNTDDPNNSAIITEARQWAETVSILSVVAMLVSSFLVITVISTIVTEQKAQIGVLKSLGANRTDHLIMYSGMALSYGVIGLIPGIIGGIFLSNELIGTTAPLLGVYISGFRLSALGIGVGIALGLGVPVIASMLPIYHGTRVTILDAMTDLGLYSTFGADRFTQKLGRLGLPFSIHRGLINIYQQRARLVLTILTLTLASGAFMGVTSVFIGLDRLVDNLYGTWNFQLLVGFRERGNDLDEIEQRIRADQSDVEAVYQAFAINVRALIDNDGLPDDPENLEDIQLQAIDPTRDAIDFDLIEGRLWTDPQTDNGLVLSRRTADLLDKSVGDTVIMTYDGLQFEFEVIGIDNYRLVAAWANLTALSDATNGVASPDVLWLRFSDDSLDGEAIADRGDAIRELLLQDGIVSGYLNQVAIRENDEVMVETAGLVFNIASGVMAGIGAIGLVVVLSISVFERQREIGVLRSIGANSTAIALQFLIEGLLVGILSWAMGIPIALLLAEILKEALPIGQFGVAFQPIALLMGLTGAIVIAIVGSLGPALSAAQRTVAEILRYS